MFRCRLLSQVLSNQHQHTKLLGYARPCIQMPCVNTLNIRQQGTVIIEDNYVKKFMKAIGWMDQSRTRLKLSSYFLYECIPDQVSYVEWFKRCQLEDTFISWFNVTELHVWLLMVRCMAEDVAENDAKGKYVKGDGHFMRNCVVEALWADVSNRIKLLEGANPSVAKKQVLELSEQFQAALVSYDEGLQDDRLLASAIWRRFYGMSHNANPENIEKIVKFIRHQIAELDKISSEHLKKSPKITWLEIGEK